MVTEGLRDVPEAVRVVAKAVLKAAAGKQPKVSMNRAVAALRRHHPAAFARLGAWLKQETVKTQFRRSGQSPALHAWSAAAFAIHAGQPATTAFGMIAPGRQPSFAFGKHHDAALLAEFLQRVKGRSPGLAVQQALGALSIEDDTRVKRLRTIIRKLAISEDELQQQYRAIREKYSLD